MENKAVDAKMINAAISLTRELGDYVDKAVGGFETAMPEASSDGSNAIWSSEWQAWMSGQTLKSLFFTEDWVFIICNLIADEISQHVMKVYSKTISSDKKIVFEEIPNHPVNDIFENPNPYQDYHSWMYNHLVEDVLGGNAIQLYSPATRNFNILPFETISLDFDRDGALSSYFFVSVNDGMGQRTSGLRLLPGNILHQKRPNPATVFWGLSPFVPGRKSVLFNRFTSDYLNAFYLRQALPGLAITMEKDASEDKVLRMLRSYEMAYTGRNNSRRTLVCPRGTDVKTLSHSITDQQLIELVKLNRENIINMLRVPKHALSLAETGSLGSEEHKQALRYFWSATLKPLCAQTGGTFTKFLKKQNLLAPNEIVMFDLSDVDVLQEYQTEKAKFGSSLKDQWTLNEIRSGVWGKEPLEGGDKLPGSNPIQIAPQPLPASPFGASAPIVPEPMANIPREVESKENEINAAIEENDRRLRHFIESKGEWYATRTKAIDETAEKSQAKYRDAFLELVVAWAGDAIAALKATAKSISGLDVITKDHVIRKAKEVDQKKLRREAVARMNERENEYLDSVLRELQQTLDTGYGVHLDTIFDEQNRAAILAIGERDKKNRYRILEARQVDTFKSLLNTTVERIMPIIESGMSDQKTIQQIAKDIADSLGDPEFSAKRAMMVARTEVLTAVSIGQAAALENTLEVIPDMKKVWINSDDERVRGNPDGLYPKSKADHWNMQGQARDAKDDFVDPKSGVRLSFPRDTKAPANETINCRCSWLMIPAEDMDAFNIPKVGES